MVHPDAVRQVLSCYPRVFFACHVRHARDPRTRKALSAHQASVLDHLDAEEPTSLMMLARHMGVTPSTMSISIARLVKGGYVERRRNPRDGRGVCLRLTAAGERIKATDRVLDPRRVRAMLGKLSSEERQAALRGLDLLARAAQESMADRSKGGRRSYV